MRKCSMLANSIWNSETASNSQEFLTQILPDSFWLKFFFLLHNPVLYVIHMESVLERLSLFPAGDKGTILFESPELWPHPETLNSGEARSAALVTSFAAGSTLLSVRHWQKGTTQVLSVILRRAPTTVFDFGISMWLPWHSFATRSKRAVVTLLSDFGPIFWIIDSQSYCIHSPTVFAIFAISVSQCFAKFRKNHISQVLQVRESPWQVFANTFSKYFEFVSQDSQGFANTSSARFAILSFARIKKSVFHKFSKVFAMGSILALKEWKALFFYAIQKQFQVLRTFFNRTIGKTDLSHSWRLFQKTSSFGFKVNSRALGAGIGLQYSLGGFDRQAQIQGVSKLGAVSSGLALEKVLPLFYIDLAQDLKRF